MRKFLFSEKSVPVALLVFCLAAFGVLIPQLGFYWDDWPMVWFAHTLGPGGFPSVFAGDRPLLSVVYVITTSILKLVPYQWQLLCLFSRWLIALSFWWAMKQVWKDANRQIAWAAILFAVYPGFKQMPISVVYGNGLFLLAFYLLSFGWMAKAIRTPSRYWVYTIIGMITYAACMFTTEYYVGLDMVRPLFIWVILREFTPDRKQRLKQTLLHWAPYLGLLIIFLIWRVFIFQFPTYQPVLLDEVSESPAVIGFNLLYRIFADAYKAGWLAWIQTFRFPQMDDFSLSSMQVYWALVAATFTIALIYLLKLFNENPNQKNRDKTAGQWHLQALVIGIFSMIAAGFPYWVTGLPIELEFQYDRFTLAFMLGSCLFIVGLMEWVIRQRVQKIVLLSLVISMAVGANLLNANTYRREWNTQKDFFWQLTWRAPAIQSDTLLLTNGMPLNYYSDNSLTAPLNWIYAPDNHSLNLPYYFAFLRVRMGRSIPSFDQFKNNLPIEQAFRNATFKGNTSQVISFYYSPPGCLRILDPAHDYETIFQPANLEPAIPYSRVDRIVVDAKPATPPEDIFGREPVHTWCYYFEQAELYRQSGDYQKVVELGDQASQKGYRTSEPSENLVFIEAYAGTGNWEQAVQLTKKTFSQEKKLQSSLCKILIRAEKKNSPNEDVLQSVEDIKNQLDCDSIKVK